MKVSRIAKVSFLALLIALFTFSSTQILIFKTWPKPAGKNTVPSVKYAFLSADLGLRLGFSCYILSSGASNNADIDVCYGFQYSLVSSTAKIIRYRQVHRIFQDVKMACH